MKQDRNISVVMCTYNGASRHLAEQLDSIFAQTLLPGEIVVQDDCSTDGTVAMLREYAAKVPEGVTMHVVENATQKGINQNFLTAMRRATGSLIAVSDQDDIWMPTKLEEQAAAIGESMMCVCRSEPFAESGAEVRYDSRRPNCNLVRLFYASMPGHCQMLRRELTELIPSEDECPEIYRRTCYDVMTATAAAALDSIVLIDRVLVRQRRYEQAATYVGVDTRRVRTADNAAYMVWYGVRNWQRVKPFMNAHFEARREYLEWVWRKAKEHGDDRIDNPQMADGIRLLHYECSRGLGALMGLERMYMKRRNTLFYTHETGLAAIVRAMLHPFMQIYNYRYLADRG